VTRFFFLSCLFVAVAVGFPMREWTLNSSEKKFRSGFFVRFIFLSGQRVPFNTERQMSSSSEIAFLKRQKKLIEDRISFLEGILATNARRRVSTATAPPPRPQSNVNNRKSDINLISEEEEEEGGDSDSGGDASLDRLFGVDPPKHKGEYDDDDDNEEDDLLNDIMEAQCLANGEQPPPPPTARVKQEPKQTTTTPQEQYRQRIQEEKERRERAIADARKNKLRGMQEMSLAKYNGGDHIDVFPKAAAKKKPQFTRSYGGGGGGFKKYGGGARYSNGYPPNGMFQQRRKKSSSGGGWKTSEFRDNDEFGRFAANEFSRSTDRGGGSTRDTTRK